MNMLSDLDANIVAYAHAHLNRDTVPDSRDDSVHYRTHSWSGDRSRTALMVVVCHDRVPTISSPGRDRTLQEGVNTHGSCDDTVYDDVSPHYTRKEKRGRITPLRS